MLKTFGRLLAAALLVVMVPLSAMAAEVENFRFSSSPSDSAAAPAKYVLL